MKMSKNENEVKMKVKMKKISFTNRESIKIYSEEKKYIFFFTKSQNWIKTVSSWKNS